MITALQFSPSGSQLFIGWNDGRVALWNVDQNQPLHQARCPAGHARQAQFIFETELLVDGANGCAFRWNPRETKIENLFYFAGGGQLTALGAYAGMAASANLVSYYPFTSHPGEPPAHDEEELGDDLYLVVSKLYENEYLIRESASDFSSRLYETTPRQLTFSPDGHYLLLLLEVVFETDPSDYYFIYNIDRLELDSSDLDLDPGVIGPAVFSQDSQIVAIARAESILLRYLRTGNESNDLEVSAPVAALTFSTDSKTLYAISQDQRLSVWEMSDEVLRFQMSLPINGSAIAASPDGNALVIGSRFGGLWKLELLNLRASVSQNNANILECLILPEE